MIKIKIVTENPNYYLQDNPAFSGNFTVSSTDLGDGTYLITAEAYNEGITIDAYDMFNGDDTMTSITLEDLSEENYLTNLNPEEFPSITSITIKDCDLSQMRINGDWGGDGETSSMLDTIKLIGNVTAVESFSYFQRLTNLDISELTGGYFQYCFDTIAITTFTLNKPIECEGCFTWCPYLTSVSITDGSLTGTCFPQCAISSISIGENVETLGDYPFQQNPITSITVDVNNAYYSDEGNCLIRKADNTLILGSGNSVIPSSVVTIGQYAFYENYTLTHITIPGSVTEICNNAFFECQYLSSVTFETPSMPHSLIIGGNAFATNSRLNFTFVDTAQNQGFNMKGMIDTNYTVQDYKIRF
jgi:hypothetical protein